MSRVASEVCSTQKTDKRKFIKPTASINLVPGTDIKPKRRENFVDGDRSAKYSKKLNVVPDTIFKENKGISLRQNVIK